MSERLLQLRPEVQVREGPASSLVLISEASKRALRVPGATRDLLVALRCGATFQQCLDAFTTSRTVDAEQKVRVFLLRLQEAGVLADDATAGDPPRRRGPQGWTISVPVPQALQDFLRPLLSVGGTTQASMIIIASVASIVMTVALIATSGNPMSRAFADWSWTAALSIILPWMLIHESAHVAAGIAVNARVVGITAGFSLMPLRLRAFVTVDPCTLPMDLGPRLALPGAGPFADLFLCGAVALLGLLTRAAGIDAAMATSLTVGLLLTALTLLPVGNTDVATMISIARQARPRDPSAAAWCGAIRAGSTGGVVSVMGLIAHGLWSLVP